MIRQVQTSHSRPHTSPLPLRSVPLMPNARRRPDVPANRPWLLPLLLLALCLLSVLVSPRAAAADPPFVIAPYVQHLDPHAVNIRFETAHRSKASVEVSPDAPGMPVRAHAPRRAQFHDLRVDGLAPGTTYRYAVHVEQTATTPVRFTTPTADPSQPFSFVVYGDCRSNPEAHASVVRSIGAQRFDFLIQTGDLVQRGDSAPQWRQFFGIEAPLLAGKPMYVSAGNHDLDGLLPHKRDAFLRYFGAPPRETSRSYFTFRWGNTRVFVLDYTLGWLGAQGAWLHAALLNARNEAGLVHRFVAVHHGPYSSGPHGGNEAFAAAGLLDQLRAAGVALVLSGHDHLYERGEHQGLKYVVSGGAGAPLYRERRRAPGSAFVASVHHFVHVRVDGDHVAIGTREADGTLLESCGFRSGESWQCEARSAAAPRTPLAPATPAPAPASERAQTCRCSFPGQRLHPREVRWLAVVVALAVVARSSSGLPTVPRASAIWGLVRRGLRRAARRTRLSVLSTHRRPKRSLAKCASSRRAWYS
jgi:hypothetical protein